MPDRISPTQSIRPFDQLRTGQAQDKLKRSYNMSRIRSKNTRPEWIVRRWLFSHGYRYRVNVRVLSGTPDIVLVGLRTCIFVNGCFWHKHEGCKYFVLPKTNTDFWLNKVNRNQERDHRVHLELKDAGWHTVDIWECQLKPKVRQQTLEGLLRTLNLIQLENMHAKMRYNVDEEDEWRGVAAEE